MSIFQDSSNPFINGLVCFKGFVIHFAIMQEVWFLLSKDEASMNRWMTAINAQIHGLFIKQYNVPQDNYWSQG